MSKEEQQDKGFRVSDRRRRSSVEGAAGGAGKEGEHQHATGASEAPAQAGEREPGARTEGERERKQSRELPPVNFSTFVLSLSSSVLVHLGLAEDPVSGSVQRDLDLARQTIDLLGMLKDKTRGNLSEDEGHLMDGILYDLRMRYVEEKKKE
ncbi:MAG: DUF1844 domain-containing protein [bacterium]